MNGAGLCSVLHGLGQQIDGDLQAGNVERARATAELAHTLAAAQAKQVPRDHLPWLMGWGEQFFRWRLFLEGALYWRGLFQALELQVGKESPDAERALVVSASFHALGGGMDAKPEMFGTAMAMAARVLGTQHPLVLELAKRFAAKQGGSPPAPAATATPPEVSGLLATAAPPRTAAPSAEELALWVTLAFLTIATADGKVADTEYLVWKTTLQEMNLPDVWEKFGASDLMERMRRGELQRRSVELAGLPREKKVDLAVVLARLVRADGTADPAEMQAMESILQWLDLSSTDLAAALKRGPTSAPAGAAPEQRREITALSSRCNEESHLYMDMRGARMPRPSQLVQLGSALVSVYTAEVDGETETQIYGFITENVGGELGEGGVPGPSTIIGPDQFLTWADILAKRVPGSPGQIDPAHHARCKADLIMAAKCLEECIKFIPSGERAVPASAFGTDAAKRKYTQEPGRFGLDRLQVVSMAYRRLAGLF